MEKIKWCMQKTNGIELVEPNENLSVAYLKKSEDALKAAKVLKDNMDWEISSCYYSMYFALYAILCRIGIKCEMHACTIEFMNIFLNDYFSSEEIKMVKKSMETRIDMQYYSDRPVSDMLYKKMIERAPVFYLKCKEIIIKLKEQEIKKIRIKVAQVKDSI